MSLDGEFYFEPFGIENKGSCVKRIINIAWLSLFLLLLAILALMSPVLPDPMATHFDFAGKPNGWQDKSAYLSTMLTIGLVTNAIFLSTAYFMRFIPGSMINLPRKDFWFSTPERKARAMEKLKLVMGVPGVMVNFILCLAQQAVYQANAPKPLFALPEGFLPLFIGLILLLSFALVLFMIRFFKPDEEEVP